MRRAQRWLAAVALAAASACSSKALPVHVIEGEPGGPYRMTLELSPPQPQPGEEVQLTWHLSHSADGSPVADLARLHERVVHNFIVALDFTSFAHIHHEDFRPLTATDLAQATFTLPYRFPHAGRYRIVSDFTHRQRNWIKQFDVEVGAAPAAPPPAADFTRTREVEDLSATLSLSPAVALAGHETELVLHLARGATPVTDLALVLGSEVHVALWREDGRDFGHTHSYTPHMAAMLGAMQDPAKDPASRARMMADMMVMMMNMPAELVYPGPDIPVHYVFPEPGVYHLFLQCAPGGKARVFHFALKVEAWREGMDTRIESIVTPARHAP